MADVMLRITGERIATPVCALARNDMHFMTDCTYLGVKALKTTVIARSEATWQSVSYTSGRMLGGRKPPHSQLRKTIIYPIT